jgi:hypothetical protein
LLRNGLSAKKPGAVAARPIAKSACAAADQVRSGCVAVKIGTHLFGVGADAQLKEFVVLLLDAGQEFHNGGLHLRSHLRTQDLESCRQAAAHFVLGGDEVRIEAFHARLVLNTERLHHRVRVVCPELDALVLHPLHVVLELSASVDEVGVRAAIVELPKRVAPSFEEGEAPAGGQHQRG